MIYIMSDLHGEYELFVALMRKIKFKTNDTLYVCGDVLDKGDRSVKLMKTLLSLPNVHMVMGNHEEAFLEYYHSLMRDVDNCDAVLEQLRRSVWGDGHLLDWEVVDAIDSLPYFIETDSFICVHAGVSLDGEGRVPTLCDENKNDYLYNRRFKKPEVLPKDSKCVFFGHTTTGAISQSGGILTYIREGGDPTNFADYLKIHLDTGVFVSGILGCFCVDDCSCHYVSRLDLR